MKIQIDHLTPVPNVLIVGCEGANGSESLRFSWDHEWKKLKKSVTFYPNEDESDSITADCKGCVVKIPDRIYQKAGVCRYVIKGEGSKRRLVSKTGYLTVLKSPENLQAPEAASLTKRKGASA